MPDDERLTWAIQEAAGVEQIDVPHHVMVKLAETLRQHGFQVCVKGLLAENRFSVLDITRPQDTGSMPLPDIGTTTVSAVLAEMTTGKIVAKGSSGNGQIRYGADVINRIIEQGKPGWPQKASERHCKGNLGPHPGKSVQGGGDLRPKHPAAVRSSQHHHEPPVRRRGRLPCAHGALHSLLLLLEWAEGWGFEAPRQSLGSCAGSSQHRLLCGRRHHCRCVCQPDLEQTGVQPLH